MPPTDTEPAPKPARSLPTSLGWGLACAVCAAGVSLDAHLLLGARIEIPNVELQRRLPDIAIVIAIFGVYGGLLGGSLIGLTYPTSDDSPRLLALTGAITGAVGGGFTIPAVILFREWISPLVTITLYWCVVGFLTGLAAHRLSRRVERQASASKNKADYQQPANFTAAKTDDQQANGNWFSVRLLPVLVLLGIGFCVLQSVLTTRY